MFTVMLLVALSVAFRHATETHLEFEVANKDEDKKKAGYLQSVALDFKLLGVDPNSGLSGLESSALTTRPRRQGANWRREATSHVLFLNQSVLADFDDRKKNRILRLVAFQARVMRRTRRFSSVLSLIWRWRHTMFRTEQWNNCCSTGSFETLHAWRHLCYQ